MRSAFLQSPSFAVSFDSHRDFASLGKKLSIIFILLFTLNSSFSQLQTTDSIPARSKNRVYLVAGAHATAYGGALLILNNTWYKNYAHTSFHTFNDSKEWLQVDKLGHAWTAYNIGRVSARSWEWSGVSQRKSALVGGTSGMIFLTIVEFLDAHSSKWGWSWSDIGANVGGSGLFISQQLLWAEQRLQLKFSFHRKDYGDLVLNARADDLFGSSWYERMLKDYNAQTYWLSGNLKSFFHTSNLPAWLNVSIGYGGDGMFGGFENKWTDGDPAVQISRTDIPRKREFYLSPDIDFTKIQTNKRWLKTIFFCLNAFKCPAPAIMIDSKGKFKAYTIYF